MPSTTGVPGHARHLFATLRAALLASTVLALPALADDTAPAPAAKAVAKPNHDEPVRNEQVIVTGTRSSNRKVYNSLSPVEVLSTATLARTGQTNLRDALAVTVPSISVIPFGTDIGGLTDAIRLRGLSPDDTLILIDGKRRHDTANIYDSAGPQQGSTPADLDMIPASMIDHIEILRDGAAAQYGSDAVAGVVNIILKKQDHGVTAQSLVGQYEAGDGFTVSSNASVGAKLGTNGFIRISLDYRHQDMTDRSGTDNRYNAHVDELFGSPESTRGALGINFEKPLTTDVSLYGVITYAHRHAEAWAFYRQLPAGSPNIYPSGYAPVQTIEENDYAATEGVKGDFHGFDWDLSSTYGADQLNAGLYSSINTDLLAATGESPTDFFIGAYRNTQLTNNLDIRRPLSLPLMSTPANLAFGAEHRYETFSITPGSSASTYGSGSSAFEGFPDLAAGSHSRDVYAAYADLDLTVVPKWEVDLAGRYEYYTDVGATETGKLSSRYAFTPWIAVRGTISNGFRAPTLAEENFTNLGVSPTAASGQLAVNSDAARKLGAVPLKAERSTNASAGIVLQPVDRLHVALDVYQINIRDRIVDGGDYSGEQAVDALASSGITVPSTISPSAVSASYFSNGASTRTQGFDITADYKTILRQYGAIDWSVGIDLNRTRITHVGTDANGNPLLNAQGIGFLTTASPRSKVILGAHWTRGRFDAMVRETRWGSTSDELQYASGANAFSTSVFIPFENKPRYLTDLELGYEPATHLHLAIGANDVFNTHPTRVPAAAQIYGVTVYDYYASQVGLSGGFYYLRANYSF